MNTEGIHSLRGVFGCEGQAVDTRWNSMLFVMLEFHAICHAGFHDEFPRWESHRIQIFIPCKIVGYMRIHMYPKYAIKLYRGRSQQLKYLVLVRIVRDQLPWL